MEELRQLQEQYEVALAAARATGTPEACQAAVDASKKLSAAVVAADALPKGRGIASRAGRRQAAERRAQRR